MKDKVNSSIVKEPEAIFIEEAYRVFKVEKKAEASWYCDGKSVVWLNGNGNVIMNSEILPSDCVRFVESIFDESFIRRKLVNACRKAKLRVSLTDNSTIKVSAKSA